MRAQSVTGPGSQFWTRLAALLLAGLLALTPILADARAGGGSSMGSRGMRSYSAPPSTSTAPYSAQPLQRSLTPEYRPAAPGMMGQPAYGNRSPFMSGLMGGLIGAGIGGMLFGHGMFGGISGFGSLFGFLIQIFLLVLLVRWLLRMFLRRQQGFAGGMGAPYAANPPPNTASPLLGAGLGGGGGGAPMGAPLAIQASDYQAFEQLLMNIQAAWTAHDLRTLSALTTPEMLSYFAEQLGEQTSRGVRNSVTDVHLEKGDLAEAWVEPQGGFGTGGAHDFATVAMRFSMIDLTRDDAGRVVDGSDHERSTATELWTFFRVPGGRWVLSAIQQAK